MDQADIINLSAGDYRAKISVAHGANCVSLRNVKWNAVILREPEEGKEPDQTFLYGMPVLFPVNRISGAVFTFEGRTYRFPVNEPATGCHLHGELHRMHFEAEDQTLHSVRCIYRATKERPYLDFPHNYRIVICYSLTQDGLEQTVEVINDSEHNMPLMLGFHTTFRIPFLEGSEGKDIRAFVPAAEEYERNEFFLPTGKIAEADEVTEKLRSGELIPEEYFISRHYRTDCDKMVLRDSKKKISLVYENCSDMPFRLIYNGGSKEFLCMEPMNCMTDCINAPFPLNKTGFSYIKPGETKRFRSVIRLCKEDNDGTYR